MSSSTQRQSNPGSVAPILVAWVLTLSDEELEHHLAWYLGGCARATYGVSIPIPTLDLPSVRARVLRLRPCTHLSMNEIFSLLDLVSSFQLTEEQLAGGAEQYPVDHMEALIESKLSEKAFLDAQRENQRPNSRAKRRRGHKSDTERRGRYLKKRARKAAKKAKKVSRKS